MKRFLDIILIAIVIFPVFIVSIFVMTYIFFVSPGPVIHWSRRFGKMNKIIEMPKFRTMKLETPQVATHLINGKDYLIKGGGLLRKLSLDELPQIWSVLIGDMSFVGPRPALFNQEDLITLRTNLGISNLLPGVTGWAQINGRDSLSLEEKVKYDLFYFKNVSLFLDLKIIFLTILKVLERDGIKH